jgi:F-type H+-transporting ATPase subunit epsilon
MENVFKLTVVTPEGEILNEPVRELTAPGTWGEFGVLPHHARYMVALGIGEIRFVDAAGERRTVAVAGGFAEVHSDGVTILAQTAEMAEKIDVARAEAAMERAAKLLEAPDADTDVDRAWAALQRSMARLEVAKASGIKPSGRTITTTEAPIPGEDEE